MESKKRKLSAPLSDAKKFKGSSNESAKEKEKIKRAVKNEVYARTGQTSQNDIVIEGSNLSDDPFGWSEVHEISSTLSVPEWIVGNVVKLLDEENTVPFIARYRKNMTKSLEAEAISEIQTKLKSLREVKEKSKSVIKTLKKSGKLDKVTERLILSSKTKLEIDHLCEPYKESGKKTLAGRAKALGLEEPCTAILHGKIGLSLFELVQPQVEGLSNVDEVKLGMQHVLAEIYSKSSEVLDLARTLSQDRYCRIVCKKKKKTASNNKELSKTKSQNKVISKVSEQNFENYFDFDCPVCSIKSHQMLAINRGVTSNILSMKVILPDSAKSKFSKVCNQKWISKYNYSSEIYELLQSAVEDSYNRLVGPLITRLAKSALTESAEKESVELFGRNLRRLLMTPPVKNCTIMGIDPGFRNGCKIAVINTNGTVVATDVIYPHTGDKNNSINTLSNLIMAHRCETIALGNATACRETEKFLSELLTKKMFAPLSPVYTIISEQGASIYSCSKEAKEEFGDMEVNLISAVSIARRLQDPMSEYLKVDVKNLGIGMYQHDISSGLLNNSLDEVVTECVSFVGIDVNTCSEKLLCHVAGLNKTKAKNIVGWRLKNGSFVNREQLSSVKGIGPKSYNQCVGFVRILPSNETLKSDLKKNSTSCGLDRTWIHPESYPIARKFMSKIGVEDSAIGYKDTVLAVRNWTKSKSLEKAAEEFQTDIPTMTLIVEGLQQTLDFDVRTQFEKPLFKTSITTMDQLKKNTILSGRITNVTSFGAFVDIGVETDGLIHVSNMRDVKGEKSVSLGQSVEVCVLSVDIPRRRIGLKLLSILSDF